jgi:hypothetical protein
VRKVFAAGRRWRVKNRILIVGALPLSFFFTHKQKGEDQQAESGQYEQIWSHESVIAGATIGPVPICHAAIHQLTLLFFSFVEEGIE